MKGSVILTLMSFHLVLGNFQVQGASNITLPTEQTTDKISDVVYPKIKVNASAPLTLKCEFKTTAPAIISTVTWRHNGKLLQKGEEYDMVIEKHVPLYLAFLTLKKPEAQSLGKYECMLSVSVGGDAKKIIELIGPPITIPPKDLTPRMAETSKYSLTCQFSANPSDNLKVEWFRDNYTLPLTLNDDMVIEDEKDENGKIVAKGNVLTFKSIKTTAKGIYFCKVTNSLGEDYLGVKIRVKSRYAYLWPLIGIILEVLIVAVIIILYEVKQRKKRKAKLLAHQRLQYNEEECQNMPGEFDADSEVRQRLARA